MSVAGSGEEGWLFEHIPEKRCEVGGGGESVVVEEVQFVGCVGVEAVAAHLVAAVGKFGGVPDPVVVSGLVPEADQSNVGVAAECVVGGKDLLVDVGDDESFWPGKGPTGGVVTQIPIGALVPAPRGGAAESSSLRLRLGGAAVEDRAVVIDHTPTGIHTAWHYLPHGGRVGKVRSGSVFE